MENKDRNVNTTDDKNVDSSSQEILNKNDKIKNDQTMVNTEGDGWNMALSQTLWIELQENLKKLNLVEYEDDISYTFEPFLSEQIIKQQTLEYHDKIPNGLVTLDMIDSEQSFQKFLGKSLNANDFDFSDDRVQIKPRSKEIVHGWGRALKESFRERLERLRREIPETVSALEQFKDFPETINAESESIDLKSLVELNTSLIGMKDEVEGKLTEIARNSRGYQRVAHGADSNGVYMLDGLKELHSENASIQQLFNPLLLNGRPVGDLIDKKAQKCEDVQSSMNLMTIRSAERSQVAKLIDKLEKRVQFLIEQTQSISNEIPFVSERNTLKDVMTELVEVFEVLQLEDMKKDEQNFEEINEIVSPLETRLRALQANLELLEGVPPRPDSKEIKSGREYKYFSHLDALNPEQRINELASLAQTNSGCRKDVDQLLNILSNQAVEHRHTAEVLGRLKYTEELNVDLKSLLTSCTKSIIDMKLALEKHKQELNAIKETLQQQNSVVEN